MITKRSSKQAYTYKDTPLGKKKYHKISINKGIIEFPVFVAGTLQVLKCLI
ncbi:MAG: hypothetical protein WC614_07550 [bacterium]